MILRDIKAFTLIELTVVILLTSILIAISSSFFYTIKFVFNNKKIISEVELYNDYLSNNELSDLYLHDYHTVEWYNNINLMDKNKLVDLYYSVSVIKPVIVNKYDNKKNPLIKTDIWNTSNNYKDLTIWLQKCYYLFDINSKKIDWKDFNLICLEPNIFDSVINLQWFIIWNNMNLLIERSKYFFNNNNYFWNNYSINDSNKELIIDWEKQENLLKWNYIFFDLLHDKIDYFYNHQFYIYKLKKLNWDIEEWIFSGSELDFTNLISNKYIPWVLNNSILDFSDLMLDREVRTNMKLWQFNDIQFIYHDPKDFTSWYQELLFLWLSKNEKY